MHAGCGGGKGGSLGEQGGCESEACEFHGCKIDVL